MFDTVIIQDHTDGDFARIDEKLQYKLVYVSFNQNYKWKHLLNVANLKHEGSKDILVCAFLFLIYRHG